MSEMSSDLRAVARRVLHDAESGGAPLDARKSFLMTAAEFDLVQAYAAYRRIDGGEPVRRLIQELAHALAEGRDPLRHRFIPTPLEGQRLLAQAVALGLTNKRLNSGLYPVKPGSRKTVSVAAMEQYFQDGIEKGWAFQYGSANEKLVYRLKHLVDAFNERQGAFGAAPAETDFEELMTRAIAAHP